MKKHFKQLYFIALVFCGIGIISGIFSLISFFQMCLYDISIPGMGFLLEYEVRKVFIAKTVIAILLALLCGTAIFLLHIDKIRNHKHSHLISLIVSASTIFISLINMLLINNIGWLNSTENASQNAENVKNYYDYTVYQMQESAIYSTFVPIIIISLIILVGAACYLKASGAKEKVVRSAPKKLSSKAKKIIIISVACAILAITLLVLIFTGVFDNARDFEYIIDRGTVTITGYTGRSSKVVVPEKIRGKYVTIIGEKAFYEKNNIKEIVLPDTVDTIESYAFPTSLEKITMSENIVYIGEYAFAHTKIKEIAFFDSLITIGNGAFYHSDLEKVTLPNSLEAIGASAFSDTSLKRITIPSSVTELESNAFSDCDLTQVTFGEGIHLTVLNSSVFSYNSLTEFIIPSSCTEINENALSNNNLTTITIPSSVVFIGDGALRSNEFTEVSFESPNGWVEEGYFDDTAVDFSSPKDNAELFNSFSYNTYKKASN